MKVLPNPIKFQWDKGNLEKNWLRHSVTQAEQEEIFFDPYKIVAKDTLHSHQEERLTIIGATKDNRILFAAFTIRNNSIRVIAAFDYGSKKQSIYYKNKEKYEKAT